MSKPVPSAKKPAVKHAPTAARLQFADIGNDMLVLKDGSARAVLEVTPICLAGFSDEEHAGLMRRYGDFLNTLDQPLQILLKSRALDIDGYIADMKAREERESRPVFKAVLKDYRGLLEKFLPYSGYGIMQRAAFLVVAVEAPKTKVSEEEGGIMSLFTPNRLLREAHAKGEKQRLLREAVDAQVEKVLEAFTPVGLPVRRLRTIELLRLFAHQYHPGTRDHEHEALFDQFETLPA